MIYPFFKMQYFISIEACPVVGHKGHMPMKNQIKGAYAIPLNMPLMKFEIVGFCSPWKKPFIEGIIGADNKTSLSLAKFRYFVLFSLMPKEYKKKGTILPLMKLFLTLLPKFLKKIINMPVYDKLHKVYKLQDIMYKLYAFLWMLKIYANWVISHHARTDSLYCSHVNKTNIRKSWNLKN